MLVQQRVAEVASLDPDEPLGLATVGVIRVDARHAPGKLDADDLEAFLVGQADAAQVLLEVLPVDEGLLALAVRTDHDRLVGRPVAGRAQLLVPRVAALEQDPVARRELRFGCPGERLPRAVASASGVGRPARPGVVTAGLADVVGDRMSGRSGECNGGNNRKENRRRRGSARLRHILQTPRTGALLPTRGKRQPIIRFLAQLETVAPTRASGRTPPAFATAGRACRRPAGRSSRSGRWPCR